MVFRLAFSAAAERDLALIFDHLFDGYRSFGESPEEALNHAAERVRRIHGSADRICIAPDRGTKRDDIFSGLRHLTIERAIFWYEIDASDAVLRVLAVFFGAQDHVRRMMLRLLER
jgi:plasmid stabilization system protein ParE